MGARCPQPPSGGCGRSRFARACARLGGPRRPAASGSLLVSRSRSARIDFLHGGPGFERRPTGRPGCVGETQRRGRARRQVDDPSAKLAARLLEESSGEPRSENQSPELARVPALLDQRHRRSDGFGHGSVRQIPRRRQAALRRCALAAALCRPSFTSR